MQKNRWGGFLDDSGGVFWMIEGCIPLLPIDTALPKVFKTTINTKVVVKGETIFYFLV